MSRKIDLVGQRFGRWFVLERAKHTTDIRNSYWLCKCDCGNTGIVNSANLKHGKSQSCGCLWLSIMNLPKGTAGFNRVVAKYKKGARDRKLLFNLTDEQVSILTQGVCHYCGILPHRKTRGKEHSAYIYNGIDRMDPTVGYVITNCVSCCFFCNRAKNNMTYENFIEYLNRITNFQLRTKNGISNTLQKDQRQ